MNQTWAWLDDTPFDYNDWDKSQPQDTSGADCGAIKFPSGLWIADDCVSKTKPYVCVFQTNKTVGTKTTTTHAPATVTPTICWTNWTYFPHTGYCYRAFDQATWQNADNQCRDVNIGVHLASIHDEAEALFVASMYCFENPSSAV